MVHLIYLDHERKPAKGKHPSSSAYKYNEIELVLTTNIESLKGLYHHRNCVQARTLRHPELYPDLSFFKKEYLILPCYFVNLE